MAENEYAISQETLIRIKKAVANRKLSIVGQKGTAGCSRPTNTTRLPDNSEAGRLLQRLESQLDAITVTNVSRVAAIKTAIAEGRYKINDRAIADRLLSASQELQ